MYGFNSLKNRILKNGPGFFFEKLCFSQKCPSEFFWKPFLSDLNLTAEFQKKGGCSVEQTKLVCLSRALGCFGVFLGRFFSVLGIFGCGERNRPHPPAYSKSEYAEISKKGVAYVFVARIRLYSLLHDNVFTIWIQRIHKKRTGAFRPPPPMYSLTRYGRIVPRYSSREYPPVSRLGIGQAYQGPDSMGKTVRE